MKIKVKQTSVSTNLLNSCLKDFGKVLNSHLVVDGNKISIHQEDDGKIKKWETTLSVSWKPKEDKKPL